MKKFYLLIFLAIISAISYFSYSLNNESSKTINIYSARKEQFINELLQNFSKETGIKYNLLIDSAPKLFAKLKSEGEKSPADVLITSDVISVLKAKNNNLIQPLKINNHNLINENLYDKSYLWYGLSLRKRLIFYNKEKINSSLLKNYEDLASAQIGKTLLIRSSNNYYNQALISQLLYRNGSERTKIILKKIVANFARDPSGGDSDQLKALIRGEGNIAVANYYYFARLQNSTEAIYKDNIHKIATLYPNQGFSGVNINLSTISMLKTSNKNLAVQKLIEYLLSEKAQQFFTNKNYEESVLKSYNELHYLKDYESLKNYDNFPDLDELIEESGWK